MLFTFTTFSVGEFNIFLFLFLFFSYALYVSIRWHNYAISIHYFINIIYYITFIIDYIETYIYINRIVLMIEVGSIMTELV